jgi:hypothetical protein
VGKDGVSLDQIMNSCTHPFPDISVNIIDKHYELWKNLIGSNELDALTMNAYQIMVSGFIPIIKRQLKDHLPGGSLRNINSNQLREYLLSAPKDNVRSERDFAQLDHCVLTKPNQSLLTRETSILFSNNNTMQWILNMDLDNLQKNIAASTKLAKVIQQKWKQTEAEVMECRIQTLAKQKAKQIAKQAEKTRQLKEKINAVHKYGGIWNLAAAENWFKDNPQKIWAEACKAQMRLLKATEPQANLTTTKQLLVFSRGGEVLNEKVLKSNLLRFLNSLDCSSNSSLPSAHALSDRNVIRNETEREKLTSTLCSKLQQVDTAMPVGADLDATIPQSSTIVSMGRGLMRMRNSNPNPKSVAGTSMSNNSNFPDLLHKRVEILFMFEDGEEWCEGKVMQKISNNSNDLFRQEFEVEFFDYPGEKYRYNLYEDFIRGDLVKN